MQICFSTYAQVVKRCLRPTVTQLELGKALMGVVSDTPSDTFSDSSVSDLFNGRKNLGYGVVTDARAIDCETAVTRFADKVVPLLTAGTLNDAVDALKRAIMLDDLIGNDVTVDCVDGLTKLEAMRSSDLDQARFLTGVLLFVCSSVKNRGTHASSAQVTDAFMRRSLADGSNRRQVLWRQGDNALIVQESDLFALARCCSPARCIVVIPVDTGFHVGLQTSLENLDPSLVSPNTLHGKLLVQLQAHGVTPQELQGRIVSNLKAQGIDANAADSVEESDAPIGSVAVVDDENVTYFLLAIAQLDAYGSAHSSRDEVRRAIQCLAAFYDRFGQGYPMLVPLVGTGRSRARLTPTQSYELIKSVFLEESGHIQGQVRIVMLSHVWREVFAPRGER